MIEIWQKLVFQQIYYSVFEKTSSIALLYLHTITENHKLETHPNAV